MRHCHWRDARRAALGCGLSAIEVLGAYPDLAEPTTRRLNAFHRLLHACPVPVGALVLIAEGYFNPRDRFFCERSIWDRHDQLERLTWGY